MIRLASLALVGALALAPPASAQSAFPAENGRALVGVTAVDAQVLVLNWLDVSADQDAFRRQAQSAFRSSIQEMGVDVSGNVGHYLFCELKVAGGDDGAVYSWSVNLYEFVVGGAHRVQWTTGGIVKVRTAGFTPRTLVEECGTGFRREWARWNPPQR